MSLFQKIIFFSLALIIIFNSSSGFLKPKLVVGEVTETAGAATEASITASAISACTSALPGTIAGAADGTNLATYACQLAQLAQKSAERTAETIKKIEDKFLIVLRDIIAKRIMNYIVNQTVKWIQGGGEPKFIGNWEGFVKDAGDIAFDSVIREVGLAGLCSPFGLQIQIGLQPVEDFGQRITCTLDKVVSNIENFYVDFSVGGWRGYKTIWEPQNNYYGVVVNIADAIIGRKAEKTKAAESEGLAGSGFMGDKICKAGSGKGDELEEKAFTSGDDAWCYENLYACKKAENPEEVCQKDFDACIASIKKDYAKEKGYNADRSGEYCKPKDLIDTTPGSLIGASMAKALGADGDWAANIQSWVSALVSAVINAVIKEGISEMKEITSDEKDSYYPEEYEPMVTEAFESDKDKMYGEINKFVNEWQYLLDTKNQSLSLASSTLAVLREMEKAKATAPSSAIVVCDASLEFIPTIIPPIIYPAIASSTVQSDIDRLTGEIGDLQTQLDKASSTINQIANADFGDEFQRNDAQIAYQNFINQYGTTAQIEAMVSGSDRQAADTEKQNKQTELDNVQTRLNACQAAISSAP